MDAGVPLYLTPMVRAWACKKRGLCCKHQGVQIDEVERRRLERKLREVGDPVAERLTEEAIGREEGWAVLPRVDEACVFLGPDNLCTVRARFGEAHYPRVCKKFPYLSIHTGERQVIGLTFQCPTALELLAKETSFDVIVDAGEPPTDSVAWLGNEDRPCWDVQGERIPVGAFWELHWALFERFRSRPERNPLERLIAFAEEVIGEEAAHPAVLRRALLRQGAFEPSVVAELEHLAGEAPQGLPWLWMHLSPQSFTLEPLPELDEEALVLRYLLHRFFCPVYYLSCADPRFLIATLFASIARYRVERERGFDLLTAVRNVDRLLVHTPQAAVALATGSTFPIWRAMAAMARAVTVG